MPSPQTEEKAASHRTSRAPGSSSSQRTGHVCGPPPAGLLLLDSAGSLPP